MDTPFGRECSKVQRVLVSPLRGDEYIVSVTGFVLVSPVLHNEELEPPSSGRSPAEDF